MASVDFPKLRPKRSGQDGRAGVGGALRRTALPSVLAQFGREVFCPWRPLEVTKPWQARTFAAAELAPSMTLKSRWVPKPWTLNVMHIVAPYVILTRYCVQKP